MWTKSQSLKEETDGTLQTLQVGIENWKEQSNLNSYAVLCFFIR